MGSGQRQIVMQDLERAEPEDVIRGIAFEAASRLEQLRYLLGPQISGSPHNFPGLIEPHLTQPADDVGHQCLGGLLVRPDNATHLLIDAGVACMVQPARAGLTADDSPWIFCKDPGVSNPATLTFLANAGPGIRWDIVECQVAADATTESSTRDVLDPITLQFAPQLLPKVTKGALTYRIRRGTQGAGIPAIDGDWMPLAAVHTRADATGFDNCDVYDIRPLEPERCYFSPLHPLVTPASSPVAGPGYKFVLEEAEFDGNAPGGINGMALGGYYRSHFGGYWSGGRIRRNTPSASTATFGGTAIAQGNVDFFNPETAENRSSGFAIAADDFFTIGAFFPRGYPRWVRYSQLPITASASNRLRKSGRLPQGPRGILMVVQGGVLANGMITPTPMPTVFGETDSAWGHVVCEGMTNGTTDYRCAFGGTSDRKFYHLTQNVTIGAGAVPTSSNRVCSSANLPVSSNITNAGNTFTSLDFALAKAYPIPPYARAVLVEFVLLLVFGGAAEVTPTRAVLRNDTDTKGSLVPWQNITTTTIAPNAVQVDAAIWVPLHGATVFDSAGAGGVPILSFGVGHDIAPVSVIGSAFLAGYQV